MNAKTAQLPESPDQMVYEFMNKTYSDITNIEKIKDFIVENYMHVYETRSESIIKKHKNGDLIRKVRLLLNLKASPHRKIEIVDGKTTEKSAWKLDYIYEPSDIRSLQHLYLTTLGNPDMHSNWTFLATFLDENLEPLPPIFVNGGITKIRKIND